MDCELILLKIESHLSVYKFFTQKLPSCDKGLMNSIYTTYNDLLNGESTIDHVKRKICNNQSLTNAFESIRRIIDKLLSQTRNSKYKIYSIHEPDVDCIAKGKAHKKYEFGCKASLVVTQRRACYVSHVFSW